MQPVSNHWPPLREPNKDTWVLHFWSNTPAKTLAFVLLFLKQPTTQMQNRISPLLFSVLNCMLIDFFKSWCCAAFALQLTVFDHNVPGTEVEPPWLLTNKSIRWVSAITGLQQTQSAVGETVSGGELKSSTGESRGWKAVCIPAPKSSLQNAFGGGYVWFMTVK